MKRKIKKGVQILTDLLEILINGQRDLDQEHQSKETQKEKKDRYTIQDSAEFVASSRARPKSGKSSTQMASGKFNKEMYDYLILNIYLYRSYGYVAIEKYEHALDDIKRAKKISAKDIDKASIYNKWLSRGILKMDTEEYLMASKYFNKASMRFP